MMRALLLVAALAGAAAPARADAADAYRRIVALAAQGRLGAALGACEAARALAPGGVWGRRIASACALLAMRRARATTLPPAADAPELALARAWARGHPPPAPRRPWLFGLASAFAPGLGHLLLGRGRDALVAAMFVWPMLALTLWAWRRRMGPVVVFFALITLWLWSGVVFSSVSLAERGLAEDYARWWAGLWRASGLPGRPW